MPTQSWHCDIMLEEQTSLNNFHKVTTLRTICKLIYRLKRVVANHILESTECFFHLFNAWHSYVTFLNTYLPISHKNIAMCNLHGMVIMILTTENLVRGSNSWKFLFVQAFNLQLAVLASTLHQWVSCAHFNFTQNATELIQLYKTFSNTNCNTAVTQRNFKARRDAIQFIILDYNG